MPCRISTTLTSATFRVLDADFLPLYVQNGEVRVYR
jgi:hypothetical protein